MPTYEYECKKCGFSFERFHSMSAPAPKRCPKCRGAVRRKIGTGGGLLFKGSGFYVTDYRSEGYRRAAKAEQPAASTPAADKKTPAPGKASPNKPAKACP
jgi:putative FmdB family regulatory protein